MSYALPKIPKTYSVYVSAWLAEDRTSSICYFIVSRDRRHVFVLDYLNVKKPTLDVYHDYRDWVKDRPKPIARFVNKGSDDFVGLAMGGGDYFTLTKNLKQTTFNTINSLLGTGQLKFYPFPLYSELAMQFETFNIKQFGDYKGFEMIAALAVGLSHFVFVFDFSPEAVEKPDYMSDIEKSRRGLLKLKPEILTYEDEFDEFNEILEYNYERRLF